MKINTDVIFESTFEFVLQNNYSITGEILHTFLEQNKQLINSDNINRFTSIGNDVLYFLHIPKTGGTSLVPILEHYFNLDSIFPEKVWNKISLQLLENISKIKLIMGHFGYGIYHLFPQKPLYITMLREPIARIISYHDHIKRDPLTNNWVDESFGAHDENLLNLLKNPEKKPLFVNNQVHYIADDTNIISVIKPTKNSDFKNFLYDYKLSFSFIKKSENELLNIAKKRIIEFAFFGLLERYDDSIFLLCYTFGFKPVRNIQYLQVSPNKYSFSDFSQETIDAINLCTKEDQELYRFAQEIFDKRFSGMVENLMTKFYKPYFSNLSFKDLMFELLELNYQHQYWKSTNEVESIFFTFDQIMLGTNWQAREMNSNGKTFCWTGPGTKSTLDLPKIKGDTLKIEFSIIYSILPEVLDNLKLSINEISVPLKHSQNNEKVIFEGTFSQSLLDQNDKFLRLQFSVNKTMSPPTNDSRKLGVAFEHISIKPI